MIVELEAETAIAQEALKTTMKQWNKADGLLASLSTTVDPRDLLPQVTKCEEAILGNINEQMFNIEWSVLAARWIGVPDLKSECQGS